MGAARNQREHDCAGLHPHRYQRRLVRRGRRPQAARPLSAPPASRGGSAGRDRDPSALGCRIGYHRLLVRDRRRPDTLTTAGTSMLDLSSRTIFGEEHAIFREQVRRFFARELTPNLDRWEEDGIVP